MKAALTPLLSLGLALTACEQVLTKTAEYNPEEAGTVDHALCLLGFKAVPLRELMTGHHLVEATLNGKPGTFVLDTGANVSVLHAEYAEEFGLSAGSAVPGAAIGLGGSMNARQVRLDSLSIGKTPIRQSRIMTSDLSQISKVLGPISGGTIHGIIGQDVMKEHRAVIDVNEPILYLIEADRDPAPIGAAACSPRSTPVQENSLANNAE